MVAESFTAGASVSKVAQRYGVNANLLFTWRRQEGRSKAVGGGEPLQLLPATVADARTAAVQPRRRAKSAGWRFRWSSTADGTVTISTAQLGNLLECNDRRMPQKTRRPMVGG